MKKYNSKTSSGALAVEFGTPSISSSNWDEFYPLDTAKLGEQLYQKFNPHLKYVNGIDHGYVILTVYPEKAKAQWYYVETLRTIDAREALKKELRVNHGSLTLK